MRLKGKLGLTLILQTLGVGASALASIVITRRYGPEGQGYLSYYSSTIDFWVSLGLFGFPQAFVYMLNSNKIKLAWAVRFSTYYSLILGVVGGSLALLLYWLGVTNSSGFDLLAVFSIIIAVTSFILHGMYRAISLATRSIRIFNLISILPEVLILLIYAVWLTHNFRLQVLSLASASLISALTAAFILKNSFQKSQFQWGESVATIKEAITYGFWSFIPGIGLTFVTNQSYALLRQGSHSEAAVGYLSVSFLLVSIVIVPLNMVIPVLFDAWSKEADKTYLQSTYLNLSHLGALIALIGYGIGLILVRPITQLVFGVKFLPSAISTKILLLGVYALYQSRLLSAFLLSIGSPRSVAIGAVIRIIAILLPAYLGFANSLAGIALVWTLGEFASVAYMTLLVYQKTNWPITAIIGISSTWIIKNLKSFLVGFHKLNEL